ncbi:MAG: L-serine ammonia-lyase, iron-sulfur-dependent, subunit alpha [Burkholderiales bacterium]
MFRNAEELLSLTEKKQCRISDIVLERECAVSGKRSEEVLSLLREYLSVMRNASEAARQKPLKTRGGLISGDAKKLTEYAKSHHTLCGDTLMLAMSRAMSCLEVNASMGKICAAPTAGSSGILPATILSVAEQFNFPEQSLLYALLTASGIGMIIDSGATLSGACGGCQAECGSAAAMAAAAVTEMMGGSAKAALSAAAIALKNVMGLVCDPVAGLVESPCSKRNASGAANALLSADLALAGVSSAIPLDEVVAAMAKVGRMMPHELRETSLGGIASTKTALEYAKRVLE